MSATTRTQFRAMIMEHLTQLCDKMERDDVPNPHPCDPNSEVAQAALKKVLDEYERLEQLFTVAEPPKKERKKRGPMSEEKKAAMKAKRAATIAAKAAAAAPMPEERDKICPSK
jgi:Zn-dependent M16 (insulinase) family peptidase